MTPPQVSKELKELQKYYSTKYKPIHSKIVSYRKYYLRIMDLNKYTSVFVSINTKLDKIINYGIKISGTNLADLQPTRKIYTTNTKIIDQFDFQKIDEGVLEAINKLAQVGDIGELTKLINKLGVRKYIKLKSLKDKL